MLSNPNEQKFLRQRTFMEWEIIICSSMMLLIGIASSNPTIYDVPPCATEACEATSKELLRSMNENADPCDDFYEFACGNFMKEEDLPADTPAVDVLGEAKILIRHQLKTLLEKPLLPSEPTPFALTKRLYKSCMDHGARVKDAKPTIYKIFNALGGWPVINGDTWNDSNFKWYELIADVTASGYENYLMSFQILAEDTHTKNVLFISRPELVIATKMLTTEALLNQYLLDMVVYAKAFGASGSFVKEMIDALQFEVALQEIALKPSNITFISVSELSNKFPNTPWKQYLNKIMKISTPITDNDTVAVDVNFLKSFENLMVNTPSRTIANYVIGRLVFYSSQFLVAPKVDTVSLTKECVESSEDLVVALGAMHAREYIPKETKAHAVDMVKDIRIQFNEIVNTANWLDEHTKEHLLIKIKAIEEMVAYPDELFNDTKLEEFYAPLKLPVDNYVVMKLLINKFNQKVIFDKWGTPYKKFIWYENALPQFRAYYKYDRNIIHIYSGMLQGRSFDVNKPSYRNYGSAGAIIAHELMHSVDTISVKFDENGIETNNVWSNISLNTFQQKAQCIIEQYGNYTEPITNKPLNGTKTIAENIADVSGVKLAYLAYKKAIERNAAQTLPNLKYTTDQLFWISTANTWCSKYTEKNLQSQLATDTHSVSRFRAIGPVSDNENFARDFGCPSGTKMNPVNKCNVW